MSNPYSTIIKKLGGGPWKKRNLPGGCRSCGRTRIDLVKTAKEVEAALEHVEKDIKVAVMGCVVNGPGEAREADIGIAGGDGCAVLFRKGTVLRKVAEEEIVPELLAEIEKL